MERNVLIQKVRSAKGNMRVNCWQVSEIEFWQVTQIEHRAEFPYEPQKALSVDPPIGDSVTASREEAPIAGR